MAKRYRLELGVLEKLLAHRVFEVIAHARDGEVVVRSAVGPAFEPDHLEPGLGQLARQDRPGPAATDHDRIGFLEHRRHRSLPDLLLSGLASLRRNPRSNAAACRTSCRSRS